LGFKAGSISNYFQQKLKDACRIGIIIILKQPPCFGYDADFEGDQLLCKMEAILHYLKFLTIFN
jgi:hypothetical protein